METDLWHPDLDGIVITHDQVSITSEVRRSGFRRSETWGVDKLEEIISKAKEHDDPYDVASVYLKLIIKDQPFRDGNHRTAYLIANEILKRNEGAFPPEENLSQDEVVAFLNSEVKFNSIAENARWLKGDNHD